MFINYNQCLFQNQKKNWHENSVYAYNSRLHTGEDKVNEQKWVSQVNNQRKVKKSKEGKLK